MKELTKKKPGQGQDGQRVVAMFGEARLVLLDGVLRLENGTMADRTEALEWAAMVCPEVRVEM